MADDRPNLLFVFTDQQWAGMMSCVGNGDLCTPAIDSLAGRGVRFDQAFCAQPLCVPSRGAMGTGLYPHQYGVPFNFHHHERSAHDGIAWVARLLADAGYATGYFGKYHQPISGDRPEVHGWQTLEPCHDQDLPRRCDAFFAAQQGEPFFLTVSLDDPHNCCEYARGVDLPGGNLPPAPDPQDCPELPPNFEIPDNEPDLIRRVQPMHPAAYPSVDWSEDQWRRYRWGYARLVERSDAYLGQILHSLETHGHRENTVVVFASDHGDGNGAHRWNQKQVLYDESIHVPLIIADPAASAAHGGVSTHLVSTGLDFMATFCDYAGIHPPADRPGRSLRPIAEGRVPSAWRDHVVVETEFGRHSHPFDLAGRCVLSDRFKYTVYSDGEQREQLTDRQTDPGEMQNLVTDPNHATTLQAMRDLLHRWGEAAEDTGEAAAGCYIGAAQR